ncbi:MAG: sodium:proline symporter [Chthoniobacter sp.]
MSNPWLLDGLVILAYFALVIGIGLYKGRGERTMEGFAVGDRNIPWWAVLASIMAAEVSAGTFLGTPGEGYGLRNFTYGQLAIGTILARIIVAYLFIRRFYELRVVSIYEFLDARFGHTTKIASSLVFLITRALASGSRMFVPAILLVVGWELIRDVHPDRHQTLLLYVGAVSFLVLITAIYTTFGGIKAVVWTDLLQVFLMFGAMFYATWTLWHAVGGWEAVTREVRTAPVDAEVVEARTQDMLRKSAGQITEADARAKVTAAVAEESTETAKTALTFWDTGIEKDPVKRAALGIWGNVKKVLETEYTVFTAFLASVFVTMATHGTDQDMVQRMLTAPDIRRSRRSLILSGLADIPVALSFTFIGVLLWVYYHLPANAARRPEGDYFVNFILRELPPGIRGIMAAGLFATAMGSLSTALNALATSFTRDFYVGLFRRHAGEYEQMVAARWSTAIFAVLLAGVGVGTAWVKLTHPEIRIIPIVLGSFGYTYGSLLGIFLVGMTTRTRGNCNGNLLAMLAGFIVVAVLSNLPNDVARMFGAQLYSPPSWLPIIEFPWRIAFGTVVTFAVAMCFRTDFTAAKSAAATR